MAVTFDAASTSSGTGSDTLTWAHTCTGTNRGLIVGVSWYLDDNTITGVTYNGVAMTAVSAKTSDPNADAGAAQQWYLVNPASGANNIVVTFNGATDTYIGGAVSATGVHQTVMLGTQVKATGTSVTPSATVTSATDELVVDVIEWWENGTGAPTVGADQTQRWSNVANANADGAGSTQVGAASSVMSWTLPASKDWVICAVAFKPAVVSTPIPIMAYNIINS